MKHAWRAIMVVLLGACATGCMAGSNDAPSENGQAPATSGVGPIGVHSYEATGLEVMLLEVRRGRGDTLTARWQYRNPTGERRLLAASQGGAPAVAEAVLVDTQNGKRYHVLQDGDERPLATSWDRDDDLSLQPGESLEAWARFPAPSESVTEISVHIPGTPAFEGVPIVP